MLQMVDNFAILSLDIAWCYLACHAVSELPDADIKLQRCEEKFKASYGSNMERVAALKGSQSNELALMARLHLLQVCLFGLECQSMQHFTAGCRGLPPWKGQGSKTPAREGEH